MILGDVFQHVMIKIAEKAIFSLSRFYPLLFWSLLRAKMTARNCAVILRLLCGNSAVRMAIFCLGFVSNTCKDFANRTACTSACELDRYSAHATTTNDVP